MLTDNEKIDLINSMKFIESDADSDGINYVLVEDNRTNRDILNRIGLTDEDINRDCFAECGTMDISMVAFRYANYYGGKTKGFYNKKHKYEIKGTWMYSEIIESEEPREKMLNIYPKLLNKNKINAALTKGECIELIFCKKCDNHLYIHDNFCKHCGNKLI